MIQDLRSRIQRQGGFALIELLIVVAIIGLMASVVLVGLGGFRARGRDARRIADLRQTQKALELYQTKNNKYPELLPSASIPAASTSGPNAPATNDSLITINYNQELGPVNKNIFGVNLLAYEPSLDNPKMKAPNYGNVDYGAGIWDPDKNAPVTEPIELAINAGLTMFRFPGGLGSNFYDWKKAIGKNRERYRFGIDEFLEVSRIVGAEPVFTISFFTGNEGDAADLVEYLNSPNDGSNPNAGTNWAKIRTENGHPQPYKVRYFEIGNETWLGNLMDIKEISSEEYAERYLKYYKAMKAIDPSIKIGAVLFYPYWDNKVAEIIKENIDFAIAHFYPPQPGLSKQILDETEPKTLFEMALALPSLREEYYLQDVLQVFKNKAGKDIPIAITEYNGGFAQASRYIYSLGNALVNAELLRIFMKPQNRILMAQHWNFLNEFWGTISNDFYENPGTLYKQYRKRPAYYVLELYKKHFGDILLNHGLEGESYNVSKFPGIAEFFAVPGLRQDTITLTIPYLGVNASKNQDGNKIYLMVINRNMDAVATTTIKIEGFMSQATGRAWILNSDSINDTNEQNSSLVKIKQEEFGIKNDTFDFTFEPHSLTAIEIERRP